MIGAIRVFTLFGSSLVVGTGPGVPSNLSRPPLVDQNGSSPGDRLDMCEETVETFIYVGNKSFLPKRQIMKEP